MTDDLDNPEQKISQYRSAAHRAEQSARETDDPHIRQGYLQIMRTWIYLAEELEREFGLADQDHADGDQSDEIFVPRPIDRHTHSRTRG